MSSILPRAQHRLRPNRGWPVIAGVIIVNSVGAGVPWYAMGILFSPLVEDFGWGRGPYSVATSIFMTLMTISSAPVGRAVDRWGSRRVMLVAAVGSALVWGLISRIGLMGQGAAIWQLYLLYGLLGTTSAGLGNVPGSALIARLFRKNRGLAMGLSVVGGGLPGVILVPLSAPFISAYGWPALALLLGALVVLGALPSIFWLLREPPDWEGQNGRRELTAPAVSARQVLRERSFWIIGIACLLGATTSAAIQVHAIPFLMDRGLSRASASSIWGFLALVGIVGKTTFGWAADRFSAKWVFSLAMVLQAASVAVALTFLGVPGAWAFALLFGLGMGGLNCSRPLLVAERFGVQVYGTVLGLVTLLSVPGRTGGQLLAGFVYDRTGSYAVPYSVFIVASLLGLAVLSRLPGALRRVLPPPLDHVEGGAV